ncbi:beta-2 adrenergic receptor-like [Dendronephthya gigantea]|uniref:beta-2 adrenergic receptor-like n=1 Tax=Dendronephthya gigantea TaxID=151771 RepID=UPI00106DCDB6|nr:beta-2 adrenergic receptor-like [Dendronephthya gigantea]
MEEGNSNGTIGSSEGKLRLCHQFIVTYYWNEAADGAHRVTNMILVPILIILAVFGVALNSLLILAYAKNSRLRTVPSMMMVALACSDLLISLLVDPVYAAKLVLEILGTSCCPLWIACRLITYFCCGVSFLTIPIMSIERFITLAYPYRHQTILTRPRLRLVVIMTWLTLFLLVISHLRLVPDSILLIIGALLNFTGLAIVISIWIWIHRLLRKHKKAIQTMQTPSDDQSRSNTKQVFRNTKTSYIVVTSVLLCYVPALMAMVYFAVSDSVSQTMTFVVDPWAEALMFSNAVINPLLVIYWHRDFRLGVRQCLPNWCGPPLESRVFQITTTQQFTK